MEVLLLQLWSLDFWSDDGEGFNKILVILVNAGHSNETNWAAFSSLLDICSGLLGGYKCILCTVIPM